jgi:peptidoglycan/xylan/chitin deacetylase (PgdA/CDA1 family)
MLRVAVLLLCLGAASRMTGEEGGPGATRIAKWKGDKTAAFMLMFDDSAQSQVKIAVPELVKRDMVGTFYVNAGSGQYSALREDWEKKLPALGMEIANHTFTHKGALDIPDLEDELAKNNEVIYRVVSGGKPRLVSFGIPGVAAGKWNITKAQLAEELPKFHLIERPPVDGHFAFIHLKTADEMFKFAQQAIDSGSAQYVLFHGVGGDWLTCPLPEFTSLLDKLAAVHDKLWIAGHIAVYQYESERDAARVQASMGAKQITVKLSCTADPAFFDEALTLVTRVPAGWKRCRIVQGALSSVAVAAQGAVIYDALPGKDAVVITPQP